MVNKVLAIQNCGPSGTTLLQSLFDGHPQVLSLPALHGQQLLIYWDHYAGPRKEFEKQDLYNRFIGDFAYFFDSSKMDNGLGLMDMGPNHDEQAYVDKQSFESYLQAEWEGLEKVSRKQFVSSVFKAYNKALGRTVDETGYLLYPIHCLPRKYALWLVEDFSEVKFLHTVREPIQSIGSLAKHINKNPGWNNHYLLTCVTAQMLCDTAIHVGKRIAYGMKPYIQDNENTLVQSRAIKLEDIHQDTKTTLTRVCDWLNLSWSDRLLESTFNGKLWHNRPESIRQAGVGSQTISQQHEDLLSAFDKLRLHYLTIPFKEYFGYQYVSVPRYMPYLMPFLIFLPFKMESLINRKRRGHFIQYMKCRLRWFIPAWKNVLSKKYTATFVKLL